MLNHSSKPVTDQGWIPSFAGVDLSERKALPQKMLPGRKFSFLADVPVMPATVLRLELLLQERSVDLRMASELVLSDVGATIQILRLIGNEYERIDERPSRIEDCIASLEVEAWFGAVSARTFSGEHAAAMVVWKHSRLIAQYAQLIAESLGGVCPDEAYMVGLLHEVGAISAGPARKVDGSIPTHRGPTNTGLTEKHVQDPGTLLAMESSLPLCVLAALCSSQEFCLTSVWGLILSAAHDLAGAGTDFDPYTFDHISPALEQMLEEIRGAADYASVAAEDPEVGPTLRTHLNADLQGL